MKLSFLGSSHGLIPLLKLCNRAYRVEVDPDIFLPEDLNKTKAAIEAKNQLSEMPVPIAQDGMQITL